MASGPITSWQIDGDSMETVTGFILGGSKITADGDCSHEIKGHLLLRRKAMTNLDSILKSRDITLPTKVHIVKAMIFPLDSNEIQPVIPKGNQSWIFIWRTDAEAEAPILWPPDVKSWFNGKDLDAGEDWRQEEKGTREDEMVGWHHWHEFEQALGDSEGHGCLVCCSSLDCKQAQLSDWTTKRSVIALLPRSIF